MSQFIRYFSFPISPWKRRWCPHLKFIPKFFSSNLYSIILYVHSGSWHPPLSSSLKEWLVGSTAGYCGADLKALCGEAALISLRRAYPQVRLLTSHQITSDQHRNSQLCFLPAILSNYLKEGDAKSLNVRTE